MDGSSRPEFGDVVIVGGGCYGSFYARQLRRARERGRAKYRQLLIVDRNPACNFAKEREADPSAHLVVEDWGEFFDHYLARRRAPAAAEPADAIVPSPLMPHLMYEWLLRRARTRWPARLVETRPVPRELGTPYDRDAPDGTRYVSFADWTCPTHCIEPAVCPVIRAPRSWEMSDALEQLRQRLDADHPTCGPVLFVCEHRVFGVGMFDVSEVLRGEAQLAAAGQSRVAVNLLVGTVSSCHGAVNLLHLGDLGARREPPDVLYSGQETNASRTAKELA